MRQRQTETKQKRSSNKAKKMHKENAKVMKDAKANKTYLCASFMTGDEIAEEQQQEQQSAKKVPFCNLPNCTNPKGHAWNTAKKCRWHGQFMHIKTRTNKGKQEIKAAVIAHLQQIGEPIMDHEPPSALGLTAVPPAHVAASPELSASSVSRPPVHDSTSSPHVNASSAASETPVNDTAYSMPSNTILLSASAASETPVNDDSSQTFSFVCGLPHFAASPKFTASTESDEN